MSDNKSDRVSLYLEDPDLGEITPYYINKIHQLLENKNARYLIMCVPSKLKFNDMREHKDICLKIKDLANQLGIEYVDLDGFFSRHIGNGKPFFERNIHFNETGHLLTYQALVDYLKSNPQAVPSLHTPSPNATNPNYNSPRALTSRP